MTPLLQQAREALRLAMPHHQGFHSKVGSAIAEALSSLDAHEAMSEYDKAIHDLAKYLPDGDYLWAAGCLWRGGREGHVVAHRVPEPNPNESSWRKVFAGRVVPQEERGRG